MITTKARTASVMSVTFFQFVSPNPGGVGPLTRAFLVRNIVERAEKLA